jgi:hypothetical protein
MRKISFILLLVTHSFYISAQEFNQAYLESLPEAVRNDIAERMIEQKAPEKASYRLSETDSGIKKQNPDNIFGSEFFNSMQTSFMPISAPNLDDSYVLDFGDVLRIQLLGQKDLIDSYKLKRDGLIYLILGQSI